VVTEAAVKQHLLRLYQKFRIPEGANRRVRLANEVVALGLVRPLPPAERAQPPAERAQPAAERAQAPAERAQAPAERTQPAADKAPAPADKALAAVAPSQPAIPAQAAPSGAHGRRRTGGLRAATPG
jgi:hypothetical protein